MRAIVDIPMNSVESIELFVNLFRYTLDQVATQAQAKRPDCKVYVVTGGMWNADGSACPLLKADGKWISPQPWKSYGYAWDTGPDITLTLDRDARDNFWSTTCLIGPNGPIEKPSYDKAGQGGKRGRAGMGIRPGYLRLYASQDGTADARTPEALRDDMAADGCTSFVMGDGGGSAQCWFDGQTISGDGRKCHNYIIVYAKKEPAETPPEKEDKPVDKITSAIMTNSACYKAGRTITPRGIMVHSTAAPGVMSDSLRNSWNSAAATAAVHGIIDDSQTLQTLPWTCRGWHAGNGTSGKTANDTHISFEICEPEECRLLAVEWVPLYRGNSGNPSWAVKRLQMELQARGYDPKGVDGSFGPGCEAAVKAYQTDAGLTVDGSCGPATRAELAKRTGSYLAYDPAATEAYFQAVWSRAVALCAKLCQDYGLDPMTDILCHAEGYRAGIASNHADVEHWFPQHGKTMDDFREEVKETMEGKTETQTPWYAEAQAWAVEMGIADGTRPEEAATRAEVWTMLQRLYQHMKGEQ